MAFQSSPSLTLILENICIAMEILTKSGHVRADETSITTRNILGIDKGSAFVGDKEFFQALNKLSASCLNS